jgi:ribosomal protein S18 acetylase RimI-like enzyme
MIEYRENDRPTIAEIVDLYRAALLRRPVDDPDRIARMYAGSPIVITAREDGRLVGILRGWTDGAFDGYVCDLAVHPDVQKRGIGRELLARCEVSCSSEVQWVLRASVIAERYYEHVGWSRIENGWFKTRKR